MASRMTCAKEVGRDEMEPAAVLETIDGYAL